MYPQKAVKLLYHLTVIPPKMAAAEALSQEISALRQRFGGDLVYLNPNKQAVGYVPRLLFGFQKLRYLRTIEKRLDIHHFYNPDAFAFPVLKFLKRPVVYTISSGLAEHRPNIKYFSALAAVAVADRRSHDRLKDWGLSNVYLVRPGIDTSRFSYSPLPLENNLRLLIASAPWTKTQFTTKGIEALLTAAQRDSHLHLVFLWRGVLADEMELRVKSMNLEDRVTLINRLVDVNEVLAGVHATVALADAPGIIKAYPHSLLDSLAAGKPVMVSQEISMAEYVRETGCGVVVESVSADRIMAGIDALERGYHVAQRAALRSGQEDFQLSAMTNSYLRVYDQVAADYLAA